ncbi:MAG: amino acid kinase family protein [Promethearchaeota archaeon]
MSSFSLKNRLIIKIGGSLFKNSESLAPIFKILKKYAVKTRDEDTSDPLTSYIFFIIPGGGMLVDNLRIKYKLDPKKDEKMNKYHWKAIRYMDENAVTMFNILKKRMQYKKKDNFLNLTSNIDLFFNMKEGILIFQPFKDLKKRNPGELAHSWGITSDSITAYYGHLLEIKTIFLIKDNPYLNFEDQNYSMISSHKLKELMFKSGYLQDIEKHLGKGTIFPVDPYIPGLIQQFKINILLLNGKNPQKIEIFLKKYPNINPNDYAQLKNYGILITP